MEKLKEKNIPFVEFYNAVDFKKQLDEKERENLEAALLDRGILDALIIPKEYIEKIKQIDIDFVDKYLFEKPVEFKHDLTQNLEVKLSQMTKIKEETVYNVLKSIMIEYKNSDTEEEYKDFPGKNDLETAYSNLRSNIITLDTIKKNVEKLENILAKKLEILKQAKEETKMKTAKLSFNLTLEVYTENLELAKDFKDFLYEMEKQHNEIVNGNEKIMTITDVLEGLTDDLDEILYEIGKKNNTLRTLKEKVQSIKQMLSSDMCDIEKQIYKQIVEQKIKIILKTIDKKYT